MDLWPLHIFCRVIECKSFSRAAGIVHLSQPSISSHIKELESHFGCQLIDRLPREAVPTQAGRLLYAYARRLLTLRDETEAAMSRHQGKFQGRLEVGGSTIPGTYLLPKILGGFKARYPRVTLALVIRDTAEVIAGVRDGALELGVVGAAAREKLILQEKLIEDEMRLVVSAEHPWAGRKRVSLSALVGEPFIIREQGSGTLRSIQDELVRVGRNADDFNVVAELGSTEAIRQGIRNRVGVSILSTLAVAEDLENGTLVALEVEGLDLKRGFFLIRHRQRSLSPLAAAFTGFLKEHFQPPLSPLSSPARRPV
jgi:DNA-binding transcriptional LysR family regulator